MHLQRGEYNLGNAILEGIPAAYDLNPEETTEYNNMVSYFNLLKDIQQDDRTEFDVTEDEKQEFINIEQAGLGVAGAYARNVLLALDEMEYVAPIQLPDLYKSSKELEELQMILNAKPPSRLEVFPNPSKRFVIVEYQLEMKINSIIEINDVNGITVKLVNIDRLQNQLTIMTQDWNPGVYIAMLKINGKLIESVKFTLIK